MAGEEEPVAGEEEPTSGGAELEPTAMKWLRFSVLVLGLFSLCCPTAGDSSGVKRMKMQFATGPLLKFQIW